MVSFLQALGAAAPNFMTGLEQGAEYSDKRKKSQREDAAYNTDLKGQKAAAAILSKYIGGGDQPAPQSPQMGPGQPSQPMQQSPQAMPMSAGGVNSGGMGSLIAQAAQKYGIPPDVGVAMGKQESGLNPNAPHGGLMQILDSTARQPGYGMQGVDPASLRDPRANADFGMHYLAARNPNVDWNDPAQRARALQSYNGGGDPNYVAHVTGRMGGGGAPQAPPQQQAPDDIFRRYQEAQKAIWTNKDLGQDFQTQFAASQHLDEQFKPMMAAAAQQAAVKHQQDMEKETADWHRQQAALRTEAEAGRNTRAAQGLEAKERMASARNVLSEKLGLLKDTRLRDQFDQRTADKQRDYDLNREKFENAKTLGEKRQALAVMRASQTAITAAARNIVYGKGLGLDDNQIKDANAAAKNLVQSLNEDVAGMEAQIKSMTKGGGAEGVTPKTVKEDTAPLSAGAKAPPPDILGKAKKALDEGRDRETVLKRLQDAGYDTGGL